MKNSPYTQLKPLFSGVVHILSHSSVLCWQTAFVSVFMAITALYSYYITDPIARHKPSVGGDGPGQRGNHI